MEYRKEGGRGRGSHVVAELGSAGADLGIRESRKSALGEPARNSSRYLQLRESEPLPSRVRLSVRLSVLGRGRCFGDGNP